MEKEPSGRVERAILELCRQEPYIDARQIAQHLFGGPPTTAQLVSVRRALRALERRGLLERATTARGRRSAAWFPKEKVRTRKKRRRAEREEETLDDMLQSIRSKRRTGTMEKLALVLGLLGSEHDGEIVNAARQAEKLRSSLGMTWLQLLGCEQPR